MNDNRHRRRSPPRFDEQLARAQKDTARLDMMERHGWLLFDGGDQVSLPGDVPLRDAIDEYCDRFDIEVK